MVINIVKNINEISAVRNNGKCSRSEWNDFSLDLVQGFTVG